MKRRVGGERGEARGLTLGAAAYGVLLEPVHLDEELVESHLHRLLLLGVAVGACSAGKGSKVA